MLAKKKAAKPSSLTPATASQPAEPGAQQQTEGWSKQDPTKLGPSKAASLPNDDPSKQDPRNADSAVTGERSNEAQQSTLPPKPGPQGTGGDVRRPGHVEFSLSQSRGTEDRIHPVAQAAGAKGVFNQADSLFEVQTQKRNKQVSLFGIFNQEVSKSSSSSYDSSSEV